MICDFTMKSLYDVALFLFSLAVLLGFVNCCHVSWANRVQNVFTVAKVAALLIIIGIGFYQLSQGKSSIVLVVHFQVQIAGLQLIQCENKLKCARMIEDILLGVMHWMSCESRIKLPNKDFVNSPTHSALHWLLHKGFSKFSISYNT